MKNKIIYRTFLALFAITLFSCASKKDFIYYQNIDNFSQKTENSTFQTILQSDDALMIIVMAENPEVAAPFNMPSVMLQSTTELEAQQMRVNSYLIDNNGFIEFPIIGSIKLGGLTRNQAISKMNELLGKYIKKPSVNIRILNFKITVQGEVAQPGVHSIMSERITLSEALSLSGDLTVYGKRENILIIREKDGKKEIARVDITNSNFINSPYYYLAQNDIIYVEPNKTKVNSSVIGPNTGIILSAISLLVTVIALTIR